MLGIVRRCSGQHEHCQLKGGNPQLGIPRAREAEQFRQELADQMTRCCKQSALARGVVIGEDNPMGRCGERPTRPSEQEWEEAPYLNTPAVDPVAGTQLLWVGPEGGIGVRTPQMTQMTLPKGLPRHSDAGSSPRNRQQTLTSSGWRNTPCLTEKS